MDKSMHSGSSKMSDNILTCVSPLEFLVKVKNFVHASLATEYNIVFLSEGFKNINLEDNVPPQALWKCFDQLDMLKKVKKYLKLIMELFIMRMEKDKEDNEKLIEWQNIFLKLSDCVFVFCLKKEYGDELIPVIKSFADILLKKLQKVDMKDYPKEVFVHNFFQSILRQFFQSTTLMNPIFEEIIKNLHDVIEAISKEKNTILSGQLVNRIECLNRYLNIVEITDRKKMKTMDSVKLHEYNLLLKKLLKVEVLPKYFSTRVEKVLDMMKYE